MDINTFYLTYGAKNFEPQCTCLVWVSDIYTTQKIIVHNKVCCDPCPSQQTVAANKHALCLDDNLVL